MIGVEKRHQAVWLQLMGCRKVSLIHLLPFFFQRQPLCLGIYDNIVQVHHQYQLTLNSHLLRCIL